MVSLRRRSCTRQDSAGRPSPNVFAPIACTGFTAASMRWTSRVEPLRPVGGRGACLWPRRRSQPPKCSGAVGSARADARLDRRHDPDDRRPAKARWDPPPSVPSVLRSAITHQSRIPVTTPTRTLADLKRVISPGLHRKATRQAEFLNLDLGEIVTDHTRSETEQRLLRICRQHRIPQPQVNVRIGPFTVDFHWPDFGLVVEVGSYGSHPGRQALDDDHARELYLAARGLRLRRFSDTQIFGQPAQVAASVLAELGQRAS